MAFVHCHNGHIFDDIKYKECPFCSNSENSETLFDSPATEFAGDMLGETEFAGASDKTVIEGDDNFDSQTAPISMPSVNASSDGLDDRTIAMEYDDIPSPPTQSHPEPVQQRRIEGFLVSYELNKYGDYFPLYLGKNFIGRHKKNDIRIEDPSVSSEHALILFRGNKILIEDKLSVNGTFINDSEESLDRKELKDNDIIRFGKINFKIKIIGDMNRD